MARLGAEQFARRAVYIRATSNRDSKTDVAHSVARDGEAPHALTLHHLLSILDLNHVILEHYPDPSAVSLISDVDLTSLQNETVRVIFDSRAAANQVNH